VNPPNSEMHGFWGNYGLLIIVTYAVEPAFHPGAYTVSRFRTLILFLFRRIIPAFLFLIQ
jgi:hypothetical protein